MGDVVYLSAHRRMTEKQWELYSDALRDLGRNPRPIEEAIEDFKRQGYPQIVLDEIYRGSGGRNAEHYILMQVFGEA